MPVIEMLACGGAVVAAPAGAVEEIAGQGIHLIRSGDISAWRDTLARLATDHDFLNGLKRKSRETAAPYTWEACARQTLRAYQALLDSPSLSSKKKLLSGNAA
jgi:alpha-1,3-rhamnosyl/mannosyltransferase